MKPDRVFIKTNPDLSAQIGSTLYTFNRWEVSVLGVMGAYVVDASGHEVWVSEEYYPTDLRSGIKQLSFFSS